MRQAFADIAFTPSVRALQKRMGGRASAARSQTDTEAPVEFGESETEFIQSRDSFYLATIGETGWPYVQHRGGPVGFVRVLDARTIGFADYRGNRQYVSVGNVSVNDRVSIIMVDYPSRTRLKLFGHAREVSADERGLLATLTTPDYPARVERGFVIRVDGFDWNCPQHITPRYTLAQIEVAVAPLHQRIAELEAQLGKV